VATFVLVHGAWHGSWCWRRVRARLRDAGHDPFTPTLTGLGERSHLLSREIDLDTHILDVVNLIRWEELSDIVLCGHSYGGMVAGGAADRLPGRIRALVYLDAFIPEDGRSTFDAMAPERAAMSRQRAAENGEGWKVPPLSGALFNVNHADREWMDRQCTPQPLATLEQPIRLTGALDRLRNVTYIRARDYPTASFDASLATARARGWRTVTLPGGHDLMLDCPEALTRELLAAAG
jgi:pimeloyl-ACP methyl ester carboxylesterase